MLINPNQREKDELYRRLRYPPPCFLIMFSLRFNRRNIIIPMKRHCSNGAPSSRTRRAQYISIQGVDLNYTGWGKKKIVINLKATTPFRIKIYFISSFSLFLRRTATKQIASKWPFFRQIISVNYFLPLLCLENCPYNVQYTLPTF